MIDPIDNDNFLLFCAKNYDSVKCNTEEFFEDIKRLKYLKKLITRYKETGELKERLILNHLIVLNNVFGAEAICKIIYFKFKKEMIYLKPFLILLNILPENIYNVGSDKVIKTDDIPMDPNIIEKLRKI